ncbi:hypothetical protein D9753_01915 [Streptomyces dangxiongensis]|uniref:acetylglutamate kinase n=1 Tax=Streptomyces dangxiongensis TaxID=1442032 RepID=A0A3G2J910_9ACTN|nr:hypothetical protein [Streptomyces dangxiongensis]AYN37915.1 hypothetical protein D9753_01915 [Streptomyces dangxiongensis]
MAGTAAGGAEREALRTVGALVGVLPGISSLYGGAVVVVAGRAVLTPGALGEAFAQDLAFLRYSGARPVVVHDAGAEPVRRAPGEDEGTALRTVAAGLVQRRLVGLVNAHGPLAVGITGEDGHTLTRTASGDLVADPGVLRTLLDDGRVPVVAAVAHGEHGPHPADVVTAARLLATHLSARRLLLPSDAEPAGPAGATLLDMAVPHVLLRTLYGLDTPTPDEVGGAHTHAPRSSENPTDRWVAEEAREGAPTGPGVRKLPRVGRR